MKTPLHETAEARRYNKNKRVFEIADDEWRMVGGTWMAGASGSLYNRDMLFQSGAVKKGKQPQPLNKKETSAPREP